MKTTWRLPAVALFLKCDRPRQATIEQLLILNAVLIRKWWLISWYDLPIHLARVFYEAAEPLHKLFASFRAPDVRITD